MKIPTGIIQPSVFALPAQVLEILPVHAETPPSSAAPSPAPADDQAAPTTLQPPGITIDAKHRHIDVPASVCPDEGAPKLIASTQNSTEHEPIVVVVASGFGPGKPRRLASPAHGPQAEMNPLPHHR